jgi:hypothetical protein
VFWHISDKEPQGVLPHGNAILVSVSRPPLWFSGQSSWLHIQRSGFDSRLRRTFSKQWVWNRVYSASWVQLRTNLKEKVAAPVYKTENTAVGIRRADHATPSICKRWH